MKKHLTLILVVLSIIFSLACIACIGKNSTPIPTPKNAPEETNDIDTDDNDMEDTGVKIEQSDTKTTPIKNGINLNFKADKKLNWHKKTAHALVVCVYQCKELNGFNQKVEEKDSISKLMECSRYDSSVNFAKRIIVQPGKDVNESMQIYDGTKYVAVVAGYYKAKKNDSFKTFVLPTKGLIGKIFSNEPIGMDINLYFKSNEFQAFNDFAKSSVKAESEKK